MSWTEFVDTGLDFLDEYGGTLLSGGIAYGTYVRESDAYDDAGNLSADAILAQAGEISQAEKESIKLYTDQYNQYREDIAPWLAQGTEALADLQEQVDKGPGDFAKPIYYDFAMDEGRKGIERKQSAKGMLKSGETLKGLHQYGQEFQDREYGKFLDRYSDNLKPLQDLAGIGQTESANAGTAGSGYASTVRGITSEADKILTSGKESLSDYKVDSDIMQDNLKTKAYTDIGQGVGFVAGASG